MRERAVLLASVLIAALAATAGKNVVHPMPTIIKEVVHGDDAVQFVSASETLTPTGEPRPDRFAPAVAEMIQGILNQAPEDGCIRYGEVWIDRVNVPLRESVDDAVGSADYIVEGVVTGRQFGFRAGEPGQLIRLSQLNAVRGTSAPRSELFVFYPVATFSVGSHVICKTDWRYGAAPADGDRLVVFALPNQTFGQFVDIVDEAGLITVRKDGALLLPKRLENANAPRTIDALRRRIDKPLLQKE